MKTIARWLFMKMYYTELLEIAKKARNRNYKSDLDGYKQVSEIKGMLIALETLDLLER